MNDESLSFKATKITNFDTVVFYDDFFKFYFVTNHDTPTCSKTQMIVYLPHHIFKN
jgi:ssDNA-binding Zn-finger/Zn-ribbon topoisomerase 1